jgi:hypothetical protein
MLGPKHTAREAAAILVDGLRDGSILLSRDDEERLVKPHTPKRSPRLVIELSSIFAFAAFGIVVVFEPHAREVVVPLVRQLISQVTGP